MERTPPLPIHQSGPLSENPFEGQKVQIQLKTKILFEGVECTEIPAYNYESVGATIHKWLRNGIIIDGGYYIPSANIACISPYKTWAEIDAMRKSRDE
jgi:hypothetical protein